VPYSQQAKRPESAGRRLILPYRRDDPGERRRALPIRSVVVASLIPLRGRPVNGSEPVGKQGSGGSVACEGRS